MLKQNNKKGFTLIETIIYLALFSVIIVVLVSVFQDMVFLKGKIDEKTEIVDTARFAMNKILYYIENAEAINSPLYSETVDTLSLNMPNAGETPLLIYVENEILKVKKGSNAAVSLTSSKLAVNNFTFTNNNYGDVQDILQIKLDVGSNNNFWHNSSISLQTSIKFGLDD